MTSVTAAGVARRWLGVFVGGFSGETRRRFETPDLLQPKGITTMRSKFVFPTRLLGLGLLTALLGSVLLLGPRSATWFARAAGNNSHTNNAALVSSNTLQVSADLAIVKTDNQDVAIPGAPLTYSMLVTNNGPAPVTSLRVIDVIPTTFLNPVFTPSTGTYNPSNGLWSDLNLQAGQSISLALSGIVAANATGTITNTATLTAPIGVIDPNQDNNSSTDTDTLTPVTDLTLSNVGSPNPAGINRDVTYTLTAANNGPSNATGVVVTNTLPANVDFVSASPLCSFASGTVSCNIGSLTPTASVSFNIVLRLRSGVPLTLVNRAVISGNETDQNLTNNEGISAIAVAMPDLTITKTHSADFIVGQIGAFTIRVTNAGTTSTTDTITVTDALPPGLIFDSAVGEGWSCGTIGQTVTCVTNMLLVPLQSTDITVKAAVTPSAGNVIINTAQVATLNDVSSANNTANDTVQVIKLADLSVSQTVTPTLVGPGDIVTFQATIRNQGPALANSVIVNSTLSAALIPIGCSSTHSGICQSPGTSSPNTRSIVFDSLPTGASAVITLTARANCPVISADDFASTISVNSLAPDPNTANNAITTKVNGTRPMANVNVTGGRTNFEFGGPAQRALNPNPQSTVFTIENTGCLPLNVNLAVRRTGPDVDSGKISNPDDSVTFPVRLLSSDGPETPVSAVSILGGQKRDFRLVFNPLIPAPAGKVTGLAAHQVLPEFLTSLLTITTNDTTFTYPITARLDIEARLINPLAPRLGPLVVLAKTSTDELAVEFSAYDANLDINFVNYQFVDGANNPIGDPVGVTLDTSLQQSGLLKGQSFTIVKKFLGADRKPPVSAVRITLFDRGGVLQEATSPPVGSAFGRVVNVSAASFGAQALASEAIAAAFGEKLSAAVAVADKSPLPTMLGGTRVFVRDSQLVDREASLFFVAPGQINYQVPPGTAAGKAMVVVANGDEIVSTGEVEIKPTAPGLFAANANGKGVASAVALRVKGDGSQSYENVAEYDASQKQFFARPLDLGGETEDVYLVLFGTGLRHHGDLSGVTATIGGVEAPVFYAGAQGGFVGLDQVNLRIPKQVAGRGELEVVLRVDGQPANVVKVSVR